MAFVSSKYNTLLLFGKWLGRKIAVMPSQLCCERAGCMGEEKVNGNSLQYKNPFC
jgi:hypothetical protein